MQDLSSDLSKKQKCQGEHILNAVINCDENNVTENVTLFEQVFHFCPPTSIFTMVFENREKVREKVFDF